MGRTLMKTLSTCFTVIGTGFSRAQGNIHKLDLTDEIAICHFLDTHQPDVLIHAAAERKPVICEQFPEHTLALNVQASEFLATQCTQRQIRLLFISTDYVFDGHQAPYDESTKPNPLNFYGKSKYHAEQAIQTVSTQHSIIRVPVLYGEVTDLDESAVTVIAQQMCKQTPSDHDHWAIRYPTHVEDIALTLRDLIKQPEALGGIFHISNHQAMTKYDMACIMAKVLNYPISLLNALPMPTQTAQRPHNCALKDTRLKKLGIQYRRDFNAAIAQILAK